MKVFFNPNMSTESFSSSPSAAKPAKVVADWISRGLDIEIVDFEPATEADLCLAHDPKFVQGVLSGKLVNGHGNRIKSVTDSLLWTNGSIVAAARAALTGGITCSPTSGFHHATHDMAMMYCSFCGICVAAIKLLNERLVKNVGVYDADAHAANGTEDIIRTLGLAEKIQHWSFGYEYTHQTFCQDQFMDDLDRTLRHMKNRGVELIIAQCAADSHVDDDLGGFQTTEDLRDRDRYLFDVCNELGMPVCVCFGGGYQVEADGSIPKVLEIHRNTALEAIRVLSIRKR